MRVRTVTARSGGAWAGLCEMTEDGCEGEAIGKARKCVSKGRRTEFFHLFMFW
jgi:hypothetical protein